jgi:hypothetical protein
MLMFLETQIQISPCILSKVRFALDLKNTRPASNKRCSRDYWISVINTLCFSYGIKNRTRRQRAINLYDELINNRIN